MIKKYFIITIRNILKQKNYSLINIIGLAIGIAGFIFIVLYITDELSYDRYHENADNIYRVCRLYRPQSTPNTNIQDEDAATCSFPLAPALQEDYPDKVKNIVRFFNLQLSKVLIEYEKDENTIKKFNEKRFFFVDSTVFEIFTFPFVKGNPENALDRPGTIVLTESMAKKYFGNENPIGKTLILEENIHFEITGILKDVPLQSHFIFDFLASMSSFRQITGGQLPDTWIWNPCWTYVLLEDGISPEILEERFPEFHKKHYDDFKDQDITLYLQALTDIHLKSHLAYEITANSFISNIYILLAIAVFILIIACINFMNLATATSTTRAKEIGVKKAYGVFRIQLIIQFLVESMIFSFISLFFALTIVEVLLPAFNSFTGKNFQTDFFIKPDVILFLIALALIIGIFAGTYPAFFLSAFKPARVLKESLQSGTKSSLVRKILVIIQFVVSITFIIGSLIVFAQLKFLRNANLGFNKEQVIIIPTVQQIILNYEAFKNELKQNPEILYVTGSDYVLGVDHNTHAFFIEGFDPDKPRYYPSLYVRYDFLETFNIEIVVGRGFSREFKTDIADAIIINEAMAKSLGWANEEAIGKSIKRDGEEIVIGVIKDFNALSLHKPASTFLLDMVNDPIGAINWTQYIAIRLNSDNYHNIIEYIGDKWKKFAPTRPFEFSFLDQDIDALYRNEEKFGKLSVILTILTIFIASLGLIGLTSFLAEQRTKEIGIRRAFGSSVFDIIKLLLKEFIVLIIIANLIAWPITYFIIKNWLQNFSRQTSISWFYFIIAGILALIITLLISIYRAYVTTRTNPAEVLRYE